MQEPTIPSVTEPIEESESQEQQYLSFWLGEELYGVDILDIEEIRVWVLPTELPRSPAYIRGVINLRGMIVPVMDLRLRFSLGNPEYFATTVVIILKASRTEQSRLMGVVVDAVSDVINASQQPSLADEKPQVQNNVGKFVGGMINVSEHVMSVLNVSELIDLEHMAEGHYV